MLKGSQKVDSRLSRDVEILTNSPFWIEALKNGHATGISQQLNSELIESEKFVSEFIKYAINYKHSKLKKSIALELTKQTSSRLTLPLEFLVESVFLAILESQNYLATSSEILKRIIDWFPEMKSECCQIKSNIETILNTTACFKRLKSYKSNHKMANCPIILGKRQYTWSINQNFVKPFVRYYYKLTALKSTCLPVAANLSEILSTFSIPLNAPVSIISMANSKQNELNRNPKNGSSLSVMDQISLFTCWKKKVEQFKLLIQIKHNHSGFSWWLQQNMDNLDKLEFIRQGQPFRLKQPQPQQHTNRKPMILTSKPSSFITSKSILKKLKKKIEVVKHTKKVKKDLTSPILTEPVVTIVELAPPVEFHLESMLTVCEEEEKNSGMNNQSISSMISETYNGQTSCSYFSMLPILDGFGTSGGLFEAHCGGVDEMFCDEITI